MDYNQDLDVRIKRDGQQGLQFNSKYTNITYLRLKCKSSLYDDLSWRNDKSERTTQWTAKSRKALKQNW